jgi:hypothetical protein
MDLLNCEDEKIEEVMFTSHRGSTFFMAAWYRGNANATAQGRVSKL